MVFQGTSPVGRSAPMEAILRAAGEATAGGVRTVIVSGEPGIGKTFLVDAVCERLRAGGWLIAWGACPETEAAPALWPWQQVLIPLVSQVRPPLELAHRLGSLIGDKAVNPTEQVIDPAEARFRQHEAVARYLALATRAKPLVIVLDDLNWADAASSRLLLDLLTLRRGGRLLIIATAHSDGSDPALEERVAHLGRDGAVQLSLEGLGPDEIAEIAEAHGVPLSSAQLSQVSERTAGNPYFVSEFLKLAAEHAGSLLNVPETVQDVIRLRLARLTDFTRELLGDAAVMGQQIDVGLLTAATDEPVELVHDALNLAQVSGLVVAHGSGELRFAHELIRQTVLADLSPVRRGQLHARVSRLIETASGEPAAIAFHAIAAGPSASERAAHFAELAGVEAAEQLAFDDAARWLTQAIELVKSSDRDPAKLVTLALALLRVQLDAGELVAARDTWAGAIRTSYLLEDRELSARALIALDAPLLWTLRGKSDVDLNIDGRAERALARLPPGDSELRCRLSGTLAAHLRAGSGNPRCEPLSAEAVAMARRLGDPGLLAVSLAARFHAIDQPRFAAEEIAVADELVELGRDHSTPAFELLGHQAAAAYRLMTFDVRLADASSAASEPLLRRLSVPAAFTIHHTWAAARLMAEGRLDDASAAYEALTAEERALGFTAADAPSAVAFGTLATLRKDWDAVAQQAALLDGAGSPFARILRAWQLAETGDPEAARALLDTGHILLPPDSAQLGMLATASEAALAARSETAARWCHEQLLPYSGWLASAGAGFVLGPVDYYLGRLARALGDVAAGDSYLLRAEEDCLREGLVWWAQRAESERIGSATRSEVVG